MEKELESHNTNNTWILVDKRENQKILNCKWAFKRKLDKFKARLVAKGCAQVKNINYCETFSPVVRQE